LSAVNCASAEQLAFRQQPPFFCFETLPRFHQKIAVSSQAFYLLLPEQFPALALLSKFLHLPG
jgi:hypothetical protein